MSEQQSPNVAATELLEKRRKQAAHARKVYQQKRIENRRYRARKKAQKATPAPKRKKRKSAGNGSIPLHMIPDKAVALPRNGGSSIYKSKAIKVREPAALLLARTLVQLLEAET